MKVLWFEITQPSHYLGSGKDEFAGNMHYAKDLEKAYTLALDILKRSGKVIENPPYFKKKYYYNPV